MNTVDKAYKLMETIQHNVSFAAMFIEIHPDEAIEHMREADKAFRNLVALAEKMSDERL